MNKFRLLLTLGIVGVLIVLSSTANAQWRHEEVWNLVKPDTADVPDCIPSTFGSITNPWGTRTACTPATPDSMLYSSKRTPVIRFDYRHDQEGAAMDSVLVTLIGRGANFDPDQDIKPLLAGKDTTAGVQFYLENGAHPHEFIPIEDIQVRIADINGPGTGDDTWNLVDPNTWEALFDFQGYGIEIDEVTEYAGQIRLEHIRVWMIVRSQGCHLVEGGYKMGGLAPNDTFAVLIQDMEDVTINGPDGSAFYDPTTERTEINFTEDHDYRSGPEWYDQAQYIRGYDVEEGPEVEIISPPDGSYTSDLFQVIRFRAWDFGQCVDWCSSYVLIDTCTEAFGTGPGAGWLDVNGDGNPDTLWMYQLLYYTGTGQFNGYEPVYQPCACPGPPWPCEYLNASPGYNRQHARDDLELGFTVFLGKECIDSVKIAPGHPGYGAPDLEWKDGWLVSVHVHAKDQGGIWNRDVHWSFTVDRTPPKIADMECSHDGVAWKDVTYSTLCYTSDTGQMVRWKVVDDIGQACACEIEPAGVDPDSLMIAVEVEGCSQPPYMRYYSPAGELQGPGLGTIIDSTINYVRWEPPYLIFDPPDCYYKTGDHVCIDVYACDAVNVPWDENSWSCARAGKAQQNDDCCGEEDCFEKNCAWLESDTQDNPCFCVDTEPPYVDESSIYPPDDSYTSDSCTPIMCQIYDQICGGSGSPHCGYGSGVGGGWMKIKITDIDGGKFHFNSVGERIPGHGSPFDRDNPGTGGWMDVANFTHEAEVAGHQDTVIFNPPEWLEDYLDDGSLPYYDGDHICVQILPYDESVCCDAPYNIPEIPYTWDFNVDEYTPRMVWHWDHWYEHCCELDSNFVSFAIVDVPQAEMDTLMWFMNWPLEWPEWFNQEFNCLFSGVNKNRVWLQFEVEADGKRDTLEGWEGSRRIHWNHPDEMGWWFDCYDAVWPDGNCGRRHNWIKLFGAHLNCQAAHYFFNEFYTKGITTIGVRVGWCDHCDVEWKNISCQLCEPCPVPRWETANCGSTYFEIDIERFPFMEPHRYWSDEYHPFDYSLRTWETCETLLDNGDCWEWHFCQGMFPAEYANWYTLFFECFPPCGGCQDRIHGPVVGHSINTNTDHFFFDTARMKVRVKRNDQWHVAYDAYYQPGCEECDLWGWYEGDNRVCVDGHYTPERINLKLVLPTVWDLGEQQGPDGPFYPQYLHFQHCDVVEVSVSAQADFALFGPDSLLDLWCEECPPEPNKDLIPPEKNGDCLVNGGETDWDVCACYDGIPDTTYVDVHTFIFDVEGPEIVDMNLHTVKGYEDVSSCNLNPHQVTDEDYGNFQLWIEGVVDNTECGVGFDCDWFWLFDRVLTDEVKAESRDQVDDNLLRDFQYAHINFYLVSALTKWNDLDMEIPAREWPEWVPDFMKDVFEQPEGTFFEQHVPDWVWEWLEMNEYYYYWYPLVPWEGVDCYYKLHPYDWGCVWLDVPEDTLYAKIFVSDNLGNVRVVDSRDYGEYLILDNVKPMPVKVEFAYDVYGQDIIGECDGQTTLNMPSRVYCFVHWNDNMDVAEEDFSVKFEDAAGKVWTVRGVTQDDYPKARADMVEVTRPGWIGSDDKTWVGVMDLDDHRMEQGDATMMLYRFSDTACNQMKPWYCDFKLFKGCDPPEICSPLEGDYISGFAPDDSCTNNQHYALLCAYFSHPELLSDVTWQFHDGVAWNDITATEYGEIDDCTCYSWSTLDAAAFGQVATIDLRVISDCGPLDTDTSLVEIDIVVDNDPPDVTITNPVQDQVVTADYLALTFEVTNEVCLADTEWHYSLDDGETWYEVDNPHHWMPENTLAEYLLRLRVTDCAGLVGCEDVTFFWRAILVGFERGGRAMDLPDAFVNAIETDWPGLWGLDDPMGDIYWIPITTYTYDPDCDLYWTPCTVRGRLYPGDNLFVTYRVGTGTPVDSILTHIPAKGTSNFPRNPIYRDGGPNSGTWVVLTNYNGFDYYGYNWVVYDETAPNDGLWIVNSEIYVDGTEFPDVAYIILDSEDPIYHITYEFEADGGPLPMIEHPIYGMIPVTTRQLVDVHIEVDQTVKPELPGDGRLWCWMDIFVYAPGELVDIDGVPACGDELVPCGLGETFDRWMNRPPMEDTTDYHYTWNVTNANQTSEGVADVFVKERDTAGNLVDIEEAEGAGNTGLHILIDVTAPGAPDETKITICDNGQATGDPSAVGTEWYPDLNALRVTIYSGSMLTDVLVEFDANNDGSFSATIGAALTAGDVVYVTATDHAGNESASTAVTVITCEEPFAYNMSAGWNMVSVPVVPDDATLTTLFPDAVASWKYNGGYQTAEEAAEGEGYWLLYGAADLEEITGLPIRTFQKDLTAGWNLVGSCFEDVAISTIVDVSTGMFPTWISPMNIWAWGGSGYLPTGTIKAGGSVWMLAEESGTIEVAVVDASVARVPVVTEEMIEPTWMSRITVQSDSEVKTLEFGAEELATSAYDRRIDRPAPPDVPSTDFVAHFTSDFGIVSNFWRDVRGLEDNSWRLNVDAESALTITWDVLAVPQDMAARLRIDGVEVDMRSQNSISLAKGPHDLDIVVRTVPKTFELAQNYPNPFNPETNITYGLPEDGTVVMKVYNVLGQEIRTLVNEQQSAGYYTVIWDGTNDNGEMVSTGVYIYSIMAGRYVDTKRMVLVK
ncbi:MAG: T9SS type A sorting domain-containing protein [Gemmatimonadota bacterium]|nr:MAG: T9SS type A sorting domain-containing protein [Gemmatimonadota bacterium]